MEIYHLRWNYHLFGLHAHHPIGRFGEYYKLVASDSLSIQSRTMIGILLET